VNGSAPSNHAWFVTRAVAYLIDALLVGAGTTGATVVTVLVGSAVGGQGRDLAERAVPIVLAGLPAILAGYNWFFWGLAGRTPGMALLGVRVVAVRGGSVSWFASLVRAVVLAYLPIGALWAVVDRRGQALHDKVARTMVVATARPHAATASAAATATASAAATATAGADHTATAGADHTATASADHTRNGRAADQPGRLSTTVEPVRQPQPS
jgi:uncharacterized RDD family membrane protein YckC